MINGERARAPWIRENSAAVILIQQIEGVVDEYCSWGEHEVGKICSQNDYGTQMQQEAAQDNISDQETCIHVSVSKSAQDRTT